MHLDRTAISQLYSWSNNYRFCAENRFYAFLTCFHIIDKVVMSVSISNMVPVFG